MPRRWPVPASELGDKGVSVVKKMACLEIAAADLGANFGDGREVPRVVGDTVLPGNGVGGGLGATLLALSGALHAFAGNLCGIEEAAETPPRQHWMMHSKMQPPQKQTNRKQMHNNKF